MNNHSSLFRPCIDLHQGKVKQIVGSTFTQTTSTSQQDTSHPKPTVTENFSSDKNASYYAQLYRQHNLRGGHVIMLGSDLENQTQAKEALQAYPKRLHVGGGLNLDNAEKWLKLGAEKVIFTSYLFVDGVFNPSRLKDLKKHLGKEKVVIDLSCQPTADGYVVMTHGWQQTTTFFLTPENLEQLKDYTDELLIHATALEGKKSGIDRDLIQHLSQHSPIEWVYAGGIHSIEEIEYLIKQNHLSKKSLGFTIGSSLDLFGGHLKFDDVLAKSKISSL